MKIIMNKEDFDELIERSLELCEFHHSDIRDLAGLAEELPPGARVLTREEMVRWIHRLKTECIGGYDWEWSSFEESKTLDDIFGTGDEE